MQDNIAVDEEFEHMSGDYSCASLDDDALPEVRLFQTVVLFELLKGEETPEQFVQWLHTPLAETYCSLANLNRSFLEQCARKIVVVEKRCGLFSHKLVLDI